MGKSKQKISCCNEIHVELRSIYELFIYYLAGKIIVIVVNYCVQNANLFLIYNQECIYKAMY